MEFTAMNILQPAPLSDEEIEEIWQQEPINEIFQLPSQEQPNQNQITYIETN